MYVGKSHFRGDPMFVGQMKDLLVWDVALSTAELDAVQLGGGLPATPPASRLDDANLVRFGSAFLRRHRRHHRRRPCQHTGHVLVAASDSCATEAPSSHPQQIVRPPPRALASVHDTGSVYLSSYSLP